MHIKSGVWSRNFGFLNGLKSWQQYTILEENFKNWSQKQNYSEENVLKKSYNLEAVKWWLNKTKTLLNISTALAAAVALSADQPEPSAQLNHLYLSVL